MPDLRIGISGWRYPPWRGKFYPKDLPQRRELEFASRKFNSIEINGSFYSLQRPESYRLWHDETPDDFVFAVKGGRFITHMKKLRDIDDALANFFASGLLRLGSKLGPILWQFPAQFAFERDRFEAFLAMLPRNTSQAAKLAKRHNDKVEGRAWTRTDRVRPIRHAFEIRHPAFLCSEFISLLRKHNAALVFADTAGLWPFSEDITADFIYIRLHGSTELYSSRYSDPELAHWAKRIKIWQSGREPKDARRCAKPAARGKSRDAYIYFDNDAKVHAPFDAIRLAGSLD